LTLALRNIFFRWNWWEKPWMKSKYWMILPETENNVLWRKFHFKLIHFRSAYIVSLIICNCHNNSSDLQYESYCFCMIVFKTCNYFPINMLTFHLFHWCH
jgi:hypothetical protein